MRLDRRDLLTAGMWTALAAAAPRKSGETAVRPTKTSVVELRQYTLKAGRRDELIELFEREFIKPQDAVGARVLGTFRDLDDPDRFVWLRGFENMAARTEALTTFYSGPVWRAHRDAANATMIDSDNVLLLRPAGPGDGLTAIGSASVDRPGVVTAYLHYLGRTEPELFAELFEQRLRPRLADLGASAVATLVTEAAENGFPRLPVREGEALFVWLTRWPEAEAADAFQTRLTGLGGWRDNVPEAALPALMRKPERLRLVPTARSPIR